LSSFSYKAFHAAQLVIAVNIAMASPTIHHRRSAVFISSPRNDSHIVANQNAARSDDIPRLRCGGADGTRTRDLRRDRPAF
jgi:hypothetical protein